MKLPRALQTNTLVHSGLGASQPHLYGILVLIVEAERYFIKTTAAHILKTLCLEINSGKLETG